MEFDWTFKKDTLVVYDSETDKIMLIYKNKSGSSLYPFLIEQQILPHSDAVFVFSCGFQNIIYRLKKYTVIGIL